MCLSELVQHLDGSAADFVFDQISAECRFNYTRLVREINSRFLFGGDAENLPYTVWQTDTKV